ncbi:MAG: two-component regulator propeller domain-containing protein, partial [Bacteroidia bacterium]
MRKYFLHSPTYLFLLGLIFFLSCKGQVKTNVPQNEGQTPKFLPFQNELAKKLDAAAQLSEYVIGILEDSKGNFWFGTMSDGAIRYDGKSFTYFSTKEGLCDNTVASIAEDKAGNIWLGTHNGVVKYDGKTFTNFTEKEGISGAGCKILVDSKGNIWAGTNHGAFFYNGSYFAPFELPKPALEKMSYKWEVGKVWEIKEDSKGNIWFGRDGYG